MSVRRSLLPPSLEWAAEFHGRLRADEPMSRHTSWHVGGPVDWWFAPRDLTDLRSFLRARPREIPVHWIGLGSNLLVRDGGLRGAAIALHGVLTRIDRLSQTVIHCEAGVPCARIAKQCVKWGLGPASFFAGIPGTLGGALAMNAGAWGGETWPHVEEVTVVGRDGSVRTRQASEYQWGYRHVTLPVADEAFIAARLQLQPHPEASNDEIKVLLDRRRDTQPIGEWSGGSTFTNPPGDHAARLIETAGLKGFRQGGAVVSLKHANFLVNEGQATAADIEGLIAHVRAEVLRVHGVELSTEVRIVGEPA